VERSVFGFFTAFLCAICLICSLQTFRKKRYGLAILFLLILVYLFAYSDFYYKFATGLARVKLVDKIGTEDELINLIKEEKNLSNPSVIELRKDSSSESILSRLVKATTRSIISEFNSEASSTSVERSYLG